MWKRAILLLFCFLLVCAPVANAIEPREAIAQSSLSFSGRTATCECSVSAYNESISVTMELWKGSTLVDSWTKTGYSTVFLTETCTVTRGQTYTLKVSGTSGGSSFGPTSVTQRCPII